MSQLPNLRSIRRRRMVHRVNPKQGDIWWIDDDEVYQKIESSNLFMSSLNTGLDNNWYGGRLDRLIQPFTLPIKFLPRAFEVLAQRWQGLVPFLCTQVRISLCTSVTSAVSYMLTEFAGCSVGRGISRGARKLARIST